MYSKGHPCLSLIDDFHLLVDRFLMYRFEYFLDALWIYAKERSLSSSLVENLAVACCLQDSHSVFFLIQSYFTADAHAFAEYFDEAVVNFIDLLAECCDVFRCLCFFAYDEDREDEVENVWCDLLTGIAPCLVGIAVTLHDEAVHAEVHGLLAERRNEVTSSSDMAWVVDDR